jgi:hypothetical protein
MPDLLDYATGGAMTLPEDIFMSLPPFTVVTYTGRLPSCMPVTSNFANIWSYGNALPIPCTSEVKHMYTHTALYIILWQVILWQVLEDSWSSIFLIICASRMVRWKPFFWFGLRTCRRIYPKKFHMCIPVRLIMQVLSSLLFCHLVDLTVWILELFVKLPVTVTVT